MFTVPNVQPGSFADVLYNMTPGVEVCSPVRANLIGHEFHIVASRQYMSNGNSDITFYR